LRTASTHKAIRASADRFQVTKDGRRPMHLVVGP
jgi:hypothetical protein